MAQKQRDSMPAGIILTGDYKLTLAALDPTTGADVASVNITSVSIQANQLQGAPEQLAFPAEAPIFVPLPAKTVSSDG